MRDLRQAAADYRLAAGRVRPIGGLAACAPQKICERDALTTHKPPLYSRLVEVFARSGVVRTDITPIAFSLGPLARVARLVQPHLDEVERRIAQQTAAFDPAIEAYVTYAVGGRGKRLRPLLALLAGGATGKINSGHLDLAVIVELIHVATLVHDDIMDATEICSGEMIQTQRRFDLKLEVEDYLRIVGKKTGSLFAASAELAALISEADLNVIETFKNFGFQIGTAYQIYDDCLDIAGSERATGKTLGTDLRKGKFTLPVLIFLQSASDFERERCCRLVLEERIEEMTELLRIGATNGALNESIAAGSDLIREAQTVLDGIAANPYADALFALGDALREMFDQLRV